MRLPSSAHTSQPWLIHEVAHDFRLEDVWALPTPGGADDFPRLVQLGVTLDPTQSSSRAVRALFTIRLKLGELFGLDAADSGVGSRVPSLRSRVPTELRDAAPLEHAALPFNTLYVTDNEFAAEAANRTMHGILHLGWVSDGAGGFRGQLAVLVKPNGLLGTAYMAAIAPFRHLIVYPTLLRGFAEAWQAGTADPTAAHA